MNLKKIILVIAVFATSASAFAESSLPGNQSAVSGKTRAEVIAEMEQAGGNLGRKNYEATFHPAPVTASTKTHGEVLVDAKERCGDVVRNK